MWTMQEIGLASSATFVCGRSHIPWVDLFRAYDWLEKAAPQADLERWKLNPSNVTSLYRWKSAAVHETFLDVLNLTARASSSRLLKRSHDVSRRRME
jgi:hypothetical protein